MKIVEEVFFCPECKVLVSESEIECNHELETTTLVDIA